MFVELGTLKLLTVHCTADPPFYVHVYKIT